MRTAKYALFIIISWMSAVKQKSEKFHNALVSAEKRKFFEETRKKILDARKEDKKEEMWQATIEMMKMFKNQDDYEHAMKLFDEYEKEREEYQDYLQKMEQESVNYQQLMEQKEKEKKLQALNQLFSKEFED